MGANYSACGFCSATDFVLGMSKTELAHLTAFVRYVAHQPSMLAALRKHDWPGFAKRYNGPDYQRTHYDTALKRAFDARVAARSKQGS
jgi:N-acetylmuramidase